LANAKNSHQEKHLDHAPLGKMDFELAEMLTNGNITKQDFIHTMKNSQ